MTALVTVLIVVSVALLITRIATVVLTLTGMSREAARFQARSALSGVGFTTAEAEAVTRHPIRRRVILALMLIGSAGLVTAVASLILTFGGASGSERGWRGLILAGGLFALWLVSKNAWVDRRLSMLVARLLRARDLDVRDYVGLLDLAGDYVVSELAVRDGDWLAGRALATLRLRDEDVIVLGIHRARGGYLGVPRGDTVIEAGDTLIAYGRAERLSELDRRSGEWRRAARERGRQDGPAAGD